RWARRPRRGGGASLTAARTIDVAGEVAEITARLEARADPSYEWGMRRTVPSQQPAHAVRVPEVRRIAAEWSRGHKDLASDDVLAVAAALWDTGWREERIVALELAARRTDARERLSWETISAWSAVIDNWELVDNMAWLLTGPLLVQHPGLVERVRAWSDSPSVWQRRLAVVTLIKAAREDAAWVSELRAIAARLKGDS